MRPAVSGSMRHAAGRGTIDARQFAVDTVARIASFDPSDFLSAATAIAVDAACVSACRWTAQSDAMA